MVVGNVAVRSAVQRNNVTTAGRQDGPVLMFAHGFGSDQGVWARFVTSTTPASASSRRCRDTCG